MCVYANSKRRFLGYMKDDNILTTSDRYVTHSGEVAFGLINEQHMAMEMAAAAADSASLEVSNYKKSHLYYDVIAYGRLKCA